VMRVYPQLRQALDAATAGAGARLYVLPTYTALLTLQEELSSRGHVEQYWERSK
jgi:hypothetical protein